MYVLCIYIYIYIYIYIWVCVCVQWCIYIYIYICVCVCIVVYGYIYIYIYICIYSLCCLYITIYVHFFHLLHLQFQGLVGMLLCSHALKSLNSIKRTQLRIWCATFIHNPCTTIISCYSSTNARDELDITAFYNRLSLFALHIPKHNVLIISGDMNAKIHKDENNKSCLHNLPNRNGEYLEAFSLKNSLSCLNFKFQKRQRNLRIYIYPNST